MPKPTNLYRRDDRVYLVEHPGRTGTVLAINGDWIYVHWDAACMGGNENVCAHYTHTELEYYTRPEADTCPKCGDSDAADCACAVERRRAQEEKYAER